MNNKDERYKQLEMGMLVEHIDLKQVSSIPWFDDPAHLQEAIQNLEHFNDVVRIRGEYRHFPLAPLSDWVLGGRWYVDRYGQLLKFEVEIYQDTPLSVRAMWDRIKRNNAVHSPDEFHQLFNDSSHKVYTKCSVGSTHTLPESNISCRQCGKHWTVENSDDCHLIRMDEYEYPADEKVIGKTLADVRQLLTRADDGKSQLIMRREFVFRNDKYIDLTEDKYGQPKNRQGWATADTRSNYYSEHHVGWDSYIVQAGDILRFDRYQFIHAKCRVESATRRERESFTKVFQDAGIEVLGSVQVPNGYSERGRAAEWFIFETDKGFFRVGWRRHVISLLQYEHGESYYDRNMFKVIEGTEDLHFDNYEALKNHFMSLTKKST